MKVLHDASTPLGERFFIIEPPGNNEVSDARQWLRDNIKPVDYYFGFRSMAIGGRIRECVIVQFVHDEDAVVFKLSFGS